MYRRAPRNRTDTRGEIVDCAGANGDCTDEDEGGEGARIRHILPPVPLFYRCAQTAIVAGARIDKSQAVDNGTPAGGGLRGTARLSCNRLAPGRHHSQEER